MDVPHSLVSGIVGRRAVSLLAQGEMSFGVNGMSLLSLSRTVGHPMCHALSGNVGRPSLSLFTVLWDIPSIPSPPQWGRPSLPHFSHMVGRPSIPYSGGAVGHPFRCGTMHYWDIPPIAHSAARWDVPCVPSYGSQMGHPIL
jgi:hypothetical protein